MESLHRPAVDVASARSGCQGLQGEAGWAGRRTLWAASPLFVGGRPCDCPGVPRARIRSCRVARLVSVGSESRERWCSMRFIGLDVHRDFCEVAIAEGGELRLAGRVETEPATLALFAQSLSVDDEVALEATGNALGIARIIEPHVGRVVLANPKAVKGITQAGAKTDKIDARTLAKLLAGGFCPRSGYRMSRRGSCVDAFPIGRSWCGSARARRTRCTRR